MADPPDPAQDVVLEAQISESVIGYVSRHPQAMDTVEGIASWWIVGRVDIRILQRVLDRLTETAVLERIQTGDRAYYRLRREASPS